MITHEDIGSKLCNLAAEGRKVPLKLLLSTGITPNERDPNLRTPLHLAASSGQKDIVEFLCSLPITDVSATDDRNCTPLEDAIRHGHGDIQRILFRRGAKLMQPDIDVQLCTAAARNDVQTLQVFFESGVDLNTADHGQRTPLHLAAASRSLEAASFLLKVAKVEVNPIDNHNCTPFDDAVREGEPVVRALLETFGGVHGRDPQLVGLHGKSEVCLYSLMLFQIVHSIQE